MRIILDNDSHVYNVHSLDIIKAVVRDLVQDQGSATAVRFVWHTMEFKHLADARKFVDQIVNKGKHT